MAAYGTDIQSEGNPVVSGLDCWQMNRNPQLPFFTLWRQSSLGIVERRRDRHHYDHTLARQPNARMNYPVGNV